VRYYTRAEFPPILGRCIARVRDFLRGRGLLRVDPEALAERVAAEDHEDPSFRVRPLEDRLLRIFDLDEVLEPPERTEEMCRRFLGPILVLAQVYDDALPALRRLRNEGYRLGLVSNSPWGSPAALWREEIRRLGLADFFEAVVFCGDAGWRKPAPEIFEHVLKVLSARPQQCLFVGDDPRWDLAGPRAVGMEAVLVDRSHSPHGPGENVIWGLAGLATVLEPIDKPSDA
jgi:putative hydrolase of the HAD superfamily